MNLETIKAKFPDLNIKPASEFSDEPNNLFWVSVGNETFSSGEKFIDYRNKTKKYPQGIHKRLYNYLQKHNLSFVFYDPETLMIY